MKKKRFPLTLCAAALLLALTGCGGGGDGPAGGDARAASASAQAASLRSELASLPLESLSEAETAGLYAMREEEQLAHDVYDASAALWGLQVFANITDSEAAHAEAMTTLLDRYALADPMQGLSAGQFPTPAMQTLFDTLAARSRLGLVQALQVGCEIEELDMRDIAAHAQAADSADILRVYDELLRGSRNHLRAFHANLERQGVGGCTPVLLDRAEFDAIVDAPMETGR